MLPRTLLILVLVAALPRAAAAEPTHRRGFAAHYRPGLMEQVARRRGLPLVDCMVASPHYKLGSWIDVQSDKNDHELRCRVTDVPHPKHRALLIKRTIVVELDFDSATVLCEIRRVRQEPPRSCPVVLSHANPG